MEDIGTAFVIAVNLIGQRDPELIGIALLSLGVSLTASGIAFSIGAPLGTALAVLRFPGKGVLVLIVNALLGLPPVVVGLVVYMLLSRSGPLGALGLLFTPPAMILAQTVLALPIVVALVHRLGETLWGEYGDALRIDGATVSRSIVTLLMMGGTGLVTLFLAAFGRAIAEVGAIIIVGGNIRGHTRTLTTAIALETSRGDLAFAVALGLILLALALCVSAAGFVLGRAVSGERQRTKR